MADNSDLFTALQMFQSGVKDLFAQRTIAQANDAVQQVKAQEGDQFKQRAALQGIANQLTLSLAGQGANPQQIAMAAGAIAPKQFATSDQAILEGTMTGDKTLVDRGIQADQAQNANRLQLMQAQSNIAEKSQGRLFDHQEAMLEKKAQLDAQRAAKAKPVSEADVGFNTNIQVANKFIDQLKASVVRSGTWESSMFGNKEDAANLDGLPYKLAITYAKIVDPSSVAREGEVQAAQKYLINLGPTANKKMVLQQIDSMKKTIADYAQARQAAKGMPNPTAGAAPAGNSSAAPDWMSFIKKP